MSSKLESLYREHFDRLCALAGAALEATGFEHLLIASGQLEYRFLDDYPHAFRVNPHFNWWVPVTDNPECLLIYTPGEKPKLAFYSPVDFWHKTHPVPQDFWTDHFDIHPIAKFDEAVSLLPGSLGRAAFIGQHNPVLDDWGVRHVNPDSLVNWLHYQRAWKSGYEIECMREANVSAARGHVAAEQAFREGKPEFDIHTAYLQVSRQTDSGLPYGNIVALNEHGATLHYQYFDREAPDVHRSFLIDAGASCRGYAADITRTYSAKQDDFAALIKRLEKSQLEICAAIKPGLDYKGLHIEMHRHIAEILSEFSFAEGSADALLATGVTAAFFPHGLGHYLGIQVHDAGGLQGDVEGSMIPRPEGHPFLRLTRQIEQDQVFTIEPGLYFIEPLLAELKNSAAGKQVNWARVDEFRPFGGIRIEDNVRVTADGHENLTRDAFAALSK